MFVHLVFLIIFDMAAHHNNGLPHEEHKKPPNQRRCQYHDTTNEHHPNSRHALKPFNPIDIPSYQAGVSAVVCLSDITRQVALYKVNDIAGQLRRQHGKIVGDDNKENANRQPEPVFPEIFVECLQMLQAWLYLRGKGTGRET